MRLPLLYLAGQQGAVVQAREFDGLLGKDITEAVEMVHLDWRTAIEIEVANHFSLWADSTDLIAIVFVARLDRPAAYGTDRRVAGQQSIAFREELRLWHRIVVEQQDALAHRLHDPTVDRVAITLVATVDEIPDPNPIPECRRDVLAVLLSCVIDDDDFQRIERVVQRTDRLEAHRQHVGTPVGRDHDGVCMARRHNRTSDNSLR